MKIDHMELEYTFLAKESTHYYIRAKNFKEASAKSETISKKTNREVVDLKFVGLETVVKVEE